MSEYTNMNNIAARAKTRNLRKVDGTRLKAFEIWPGGNWKKIM